MNQELEQSFRTPAQQRRLGIAIVIAVVVLTVTQLLYIFEDNDDDQPLRLAQELVTLHKADNPDARPISDWDKLAALFPSLDFKPKPPRRLSNDYRLQSAVLLSKQNRLQLRLLDGENRPTSLFIQPFNDELRTLDNRSQLREQWLVSYWYEGELFYALVAEEQ